MASRARQARVALVCALLILGGWGTYWVLQIFDVIELLRLAYG